MFSVTGASATTRTRKPDGPGRREAGEHGGRAHHVVLHLPHRRRGLQRDAPGVEGDALADEDRGSPRAGGSVLPDQKERRAGSFPRSRRGGRPSSPSRSPCGRAPGTRSDAARRGPSPRPRARRAQVVAGRVADVARPAHGVGHGFGLPNGRRESSAPRRRAAARRSPAREGVAPCRRTCNGRRRSPRARSAAGAPGRRPPTPRRRRRERAAGRAAPRLADGLRIVARHRDADAGAGPRPYSVQAPPPEPADAISLSLPRKRAARTADRSAGGDGPGSPGGRVPRFVQKRDAHGRGGARRGIRQSHSHGTSYDNRAAGCANFTGP